MRNKVTSSWVKRVPKTKKPVTAHSMAALLERRYETPRRCTEKMFLAKPELKSSHTNRVDRITMNTDSPPPEQKTV